MTIRRHSLFEQVIVLTDASNGVGLAAALLAAQRGANLVLAAPSVDMLDGTVDAIIESGGQAICVRANAGKRVDVERIAAEAIDVYGRIDTWVNNAGVSVDGVSDTEEDKRRLFETNFWGVVNGSLVALPHLKKEGGALINVGSDDSGCLAPLLGVYNIKHAVKSFTDALRVEVVNLDNALVSITLIQPAATDRRYSDHLGNITSHGPTSHALGPRRVAEAILDAAMYGGRDVTVSGRASMNATFDRVFPLFVARPASVRPAT